MPRRQPRPSGPRSLRSPPRTSYNTVSLKSRTNQFRTLGNADSRRFPGAGRAREATARAPSPRPEPRPRSWPVPRPRAVLSAGGGHSRSAHAPQAARTGPQKPRRREHAVARAGAAGRPAGAGTVTPPQAPGCAPHQAPRGVREPRPSATSLSSDPSFPGRWLKVPGAPPPPRAPDRSPPLPSSKASMRQGCRPGHTLPRAGRSCWLVSAHGTAPGVLGPQGRLASKNQV